VTPELEWQVEAFLSPGSPARELVNVDPYPFFDRLRAADPVHHSRKGPWLLTRYDDVLTLLQSADFTQDHRAMRLAQHPEQETLETRPGLRLIESGMLWRDPPDHTRLRRLVQMAFRPSVIASWEPRIAEIARGRLNDLRDRESFDFLHEFAMKLPGAVIAEMIGMPPEHAAQYEKWAEAGIVVQDAGSSPADLTEADRLAVECLDYFAELIHAKRRDPGDDILSSLIEADTEEEQKATHEEIVGMCVLLHLAGHETTSNVLTNGMYHLLSNAEQYDALRADASLVPNAVDEVLRFDVSARNTMPRWAARDTTIGDTSIPKGEQVFGIFGAAHRDPARFVDPNRFDIRREDVGHLAFGFGIHYCLGARLARLELVTALTLLAADFPRMSLVTEDVRWRDVLILRALERLEVAW